MKVKGIGGTIAYNSKEYKIGDVFILPKQEANRLIKLKFVKEVVEPQPEPVKPNSTKSNPDKPEPVEPNSAKSEDEV